MYVYSLSTVSGNTKLVSLSGAVKLAAVSNIQIPGTVIQTIRKYCKVRRNGEGCVAFSSLLCCVALS